MLFCNKKSNTFTLNRQLIRKPGPAEPGHALPLQTV